MSTESYDKLVMAIEQMDHDGDSYTFAVAQGTHRLELTLADTVDSFEEVRIVLNSNGTWETFIEQSKKQKIFTTLRNRWPVFTDWDDDDMTNLLDELDVKY